MLKNRPVLSLLVIALLVSACASEPAGAPTEPERKTIGKGLSGGKKKSATKPKPSTPAAPATGGRDGTIVLTVKDAAGQPRPWIQIRVTSNSGATTTTLMTDFAGKARATVTSGTWHAEIVPGCQERVNVTFAEGATLEVTGERTAKARLRVEATRRYMAGGEVRWGITPPWPDDKNVTAKVRWIDRCTGEPRASDRLGEHVFVRGSEKIRILELAESSDAKGWIALTFYCAGSGGNARDYAITFSDRFNEADEVNLLPARDAPSGGWCA